MVEQKKEIRGDEGSLDRIFQKDREDIISWPQWMRDIVNKEFTRRGLTIDENLEPIAISSAPLQSNPDRQ